MTKTTEETITSSHKNIYLREDETTSVTVISSKTLTSITLTSEGDQKVDTSSTDKFFVETETTIGSKQPPASAINTKTEVERTYSKVISIDEDNQRVKFKMFLPKGELLRSMDLDMFEDVKLAYVGAEFNFTVIKEKGRLSVQIEPYFPEYNPEMEDIFDELTELTE